MKPLIEKIAKQPVLILGMFSWSKKLVVLAIISFKLVLELTLVELARV